jgi:hypothetical protein
MTEHKAKPEQWAADRYDWSRADTEALHGDTAFRCIMELRSRVEALEAAQRPTVTVKDSLTVPVDSLMEEVVDAITDASAAYGTADEPARAAILATANWLDQQELHDAAKRLRQEVG